MKAEVAKKWVRALRSGKYKQGKHALKYKSKRGVVRHCCLGVLCELYQKDHKRKLSTGKIKSSNPDPDLPEGSVGMHFARADTHLPEAVRKWAGMESVEGSFLRPADADGYGGRTSLAELNDEGSNFKKIADVIEARSDQL